MSKMLVYGNEPYLLYNCKKRAVEGLAMPEFNLRVSREFGEEEKKFAYQKPFCSKRRVIIIEADKLTANEVLDSYLKKPANHTELYICVKEVDKRLAIYKRFAKTEKQILNKVAQDVLERWIVNFMKERNCKITKHAYQLFIRRINYGLEDVSLYHVRAALLRLCATETEIGIELVERIVPVNEEEDIFRLVRLITEDKKGDLFHQATLTVQSQKQNVINTLAFLLRSYRLVYKANVCSCTLKDMGVNYGAYLPRLSGQQAGTCIDMIQGYINGVKNGTYNQEIALKLCLAKLCEIK